MPYRAAVLDVTRNESRSGEERENKTGLQFNHQKPRFIGFSENSIKFKGSASEVRADILEESMSNSEICTGQISVRMGASGDFDFAKFLSSTYLQIPVLMQPRTGFQKV